MMLSTRIKICFL